MSDKKPNPHDNVIDLSLQRVFRETIEEGVPDRFMNLLNQLKQQDEERESSK